MLCHMLLMNYRTASSGRDLCFHSTALPKVLYPPPRQQHSDVPSCLGGQTRDMLGTATAPCTGTSWEGVGVAGASMCGGI